MSKIIPVQLLRFYGVLYIARSVSQSRYAQLTRCFSTVAELLVTPVGELTYDSSSPKCTTVASNPH